MMMKRLLYVLIGSNVMTFTKSYTKLNYINQYKTRRYISTCSLAMSPSSYPTNDNIKRSSGLLRRFISKRNSTTSTDSQYIKNVMYLWVEKFVFGLKLCPFSGSVLADNKMNIYVSHDGDDDKGLQNIFEYIVSESEFIMNNNKNEDDRHSTTLLVLSSSTWSDFENYLQLVEDVEELLVNSKLDTGIQVASFHPSYIFADTEETSVDNFTNRSPYPCLHLLKVDEVTKAIASYGDTKMIYENNIKRMRKMGIKKIMQINEEISKDAKNRSSSS